MADEKRRTEEEANPTPEDGAELEALLALLRNEHGMKPAAKNNKDNEKIADPDGLEEFEFDDRPIEADYPNYNIIGKGASYGEGSDEVSETAEELTEEEETFDTEPEAVDSEVAGEMLSGEEPTDRDEPKTESGILEDIEDFPTSEETKSEEELSSEEESAVAEEESVIENTADESILPEKMAAEEAKDKPVGEGSEDAEPSSAEEPANAEIFLPDEEAADEEDSGGEEDPLYQAIRLRYTAERGLTEEDADRAEDSLTRSTDDLPAADAKEADYPVADTEEEGTAVRSDTEENGTRTEKESVSEEERLSEELLTQEPTTEESASLEPESAEESLWDWSDLNEEAPEKEEVVQDALDREDSQESGAEETGEEEERPELSAQEDFSDLNRSDRFAWLFSEEETESLESNGSTESADFTEENLSDDMLASPAEEWDEEKEDFEKASSFEEQKADCGLAEKNIEEKPEDNIDTNVEGNAEAEAAPAEKEEDPFDLSAAMGLKSRDSNLAPKPRGRGSSVPIEEEAEETVPSFRAILPSRRYNREFTSYSQADFIQKSYRARLKSELTRLELLLVLTLLAFCAESAHLIGISFLDPAVNPIVAICVSAVLIVLACILTMREYSDGAVMLFRGRPVPESILFLLLMAPLLYYIVVIAGGEIPDMVFGFAFCVGALVCKLQTVLRVLREIKSFSVVAAEKPKRILSRMSSEQAGREREAFEGFASPEARYFCVKRTLFVEDYFGKTNSVTKSKVSVAIFLALSLAIGGLIFALAYAKGMGVSDSLSYAVLSLFYTLPFSVFLLFEAPLFWAALSAFRDQAAIVGEAAADYCGEDSVVSFSDSDIFPPSDISLVNIMLFGEKNLEKLMRYTALLFDEINSSVGTVLSRSLPVQDLKGEMRIANVYDDGIEALVDGEQLLVGGFSFMQTVGVVFPDRYVPQKTSLTETFVAVDGELLGKLDFDYRLAPDSADALTYLAEAGSYIAIRTLDPNITPEFMSQKLDYPNSPIKLMKAGDDRELLRMRKRLSGSLVSCGGTKSLMNALVLCGKSDFARKVGMIFASASLLAGTALVVMSLMLGNTALINGRGIALFQLFWLLPILAVSIFYVQNRRRKKEWRAEKKRKAARAKAGKDTAAAGKAGSEKTAAEPEKKDPQDTSR